MDETQLIKKWEPILMYTDFDGKYIPPQKWTEAANELEDIEKKVGVTRFKELLRTIYRKYTINK